MKCQILFSRKNKKKHLSSAEFAQSMESVKEIAYSDTIRCVYLDK